MSSIAFSAGLQHHLTVNDDEKVKFDEIFINQGAAYDTSTGVFTCKTEGLYVFFVHALARQHNKMWLELHHNYQHAVSLYGHSTSGWASGSNAATLALHVGDIVYVGARHPTEPPNNLYGVLGETYCTFSGYLVAPLNSFSPVVG
jgi:hypothetical protein